MKKLGAIFQNQVEKTNEEDLIWVLNENGNIGIEIELENIRNTRMGRARTPNAPFNIGGVWKCVEDGSLRNRGAEFVSDVLWGKDLTDALKYLLEDYLPNREQPVLSSRCSMHIHMDVRDLNILQLQRLLQFYLIFEKVLFNYVGDRENNEYCIPYYSSVAGQLQLSKIMHPKSDINIMIDKGVDEASIEWIESQFIKYMALNLRPFCRAGSIEFRHSSATLNMEAVKDWINILYCLKKFAIEYDGETEPYENFSVIGPYGFFREVFGEYADKLDYPDIASDLWEGCRVAQDTYNLMALGQVKVDYNKIINGFINKFYKKDYKSKENKKSKPRLDIPTPEENMDRLRHNYQHINTYFVTNTEATTAGTFRNTADRNLENLEQQVRQYIEDDEVY